MRLKLTIHTDGNAWRPPTLDEWGLDLGGGPHRSLAVVERVERTAPAIVEVTLRLRDETDGGRGAATEEPDDDDYPFVAYVTDAELLP